MCIAVSASVSPDLIPTSTPAAIACESEDSVPDRGLPVARQESTSASDMGGSENRPVRGDFRVPVISIPGTTSPEVRVARMSRPGLSMGPANIN
jgi:hypothetical protein